MKRTDTIQPLDIVETQTNWDNLKHAEIINMEMVQVAILIAIAIALGLIFKTQIGAFVDNVFGDLLGSDF